MEMMKNFTCIGKGHGAPCLPATREDWEALRREPWLAQMCERIEKGDEQLKHRLPVWTPHCAEFKDNHRAIADALKPLNRLMLDFDEKGHTEEIKAKLLESSPLEPLLIEESVRRGTHVLVELPDGMDADTAQQLMKEATGFTPDAAVKDVSRCIYMVTEAHTKYVNPKLFDTTECKKTNTNLQLGGANKNNSADSVDSCSEKTNLCFKGIKYEEIIREYWRRNGGEPAEGERNVKLYQLAVNLRAICDNKKEVLMEIMPRFGLPEMELKAVVDSACKEPPKGISKMMKEIIQSEEFKVDDEKLDADIEDDTTSNLQSQISNLKMPMGIKDSIEAVGSALEMPVLTAVCPCIGALATGVVLDVHSQKKGLNLISYIAGDFASGKGSIDPVVEAWMSEVLALDKMYQQQEEEWRNKKKAAKNKKEQPEEPQLPVRYLTLNNTVAKLAERLANTEGKHAFSFTPEADTVAQKWKSVMSDFSVMLRQSYDGSKFDREAKSVDAVNVHIDHLLWNVVMCGTPDALYRVVNNYTDGFQSRIAVARTPDNTFAPLEEKPHVLTDRQKDRIQQIAHLLPLMQGEVVLPRLEAKGRAWLEKIRLETMKNDDRTKARQRIRVCVTAQRMTCCVMLCKVCETLIQKHGCNGAETLLKQYPDKWKELLQKTQTPQMLEIYDAIADSLLENALYFFRDRIENAFSSRNYIGATNGERTKRGKNDSIFERLDVQFTFEQAMQHSVAIKGANVTRNTVMQMLKNWRNQGLVLMTEIGKYRKVES